MTTTPDTTTAFTLAAVLRLMEYMNDRPDQFDTTQIIPEWQEALSPEDYEVVFSPEVDLLVQGTIMEIELANLKSAIEALFNVA